MKTLKTSLIILCLLPFRVGGLPQSDGGNFFMEEWKNIDGFYGKYQISSLGKVKSFCLDSPKILKPCITIDGYEFIRLSMGTKKIKPKIVRVHRLVAEHFIPNPLNKPQVNHKDFNKKNNTILNLEWCDQFENMKHCCDGGMFPRRDGKYNGRAKIVLNTETGIFYNTALEASVSHNIKPTTLRGYLGGFSKNISSMIYV